MPCNNSDQSQASPRDKGNNADRAFWAARCRSKEGGHLQGEFVNFCSRKVEKILCPMHLLGIWFETPWHLCHECPVLVHKKKGLLFCCSNRQVSRPGLCVLVSKEDILFSADSSGGGYLHQFSAVHDTCGYLLHCSLCGRVVSQSRYIKMFPFHWYSMHCIYLNSARVSIYIRFARKQERVASLL